MLRFVLLLFFYFTIRRKNEQPWRSGRDNEAAVTNRSRWSCERTKEKQVQIIMARIRKGRRKRNGEFKPKSLGRPSAFFRNLQHLACWDTVSTLSAHAGNENSRTVVPLNHHRGFVAEFPSRWTEFVTLILSVCKRLFHPPKYAVKIKNRQ